MVTALFAGLLTKVGIYAIIRVVTLLLADDIQAWQNLLLGIAALASYHTGVPFSIGTRTAALRLFEKAQK